MKRRNEKKELMKIVDEIDTILFGSPLYKSYIMPEFQDVAFGLICAISGLGLSAVFSEDVNVADLFNGVALGVLGGAYWQTEKNGERINDYENAYLKLDRNKQLEILRLAKKLSLAIDVDVKFKRNKKYFNSYLINKNNLNLFERMDRYVPHFEILSKEKIEEIHNNGNLTPEEKFTEWMELNYCIYGKSKCDKYDNCRACLIDCANQREEWPRLRNVPGSDYITSFDEKQKVKTKGTINKD